MKHQYLDLFQPFIIWFCQTEHVMGKFGRHEVFEVQRKIFVGDFVTFSDIMRAQPEDDHRPNALNYLKCQHIISTSFKSYFIVTS